MEFSRQAYWSGLPFPSSSANPDIRILLLILMLVTLPKDIWGGFRHKVEFREWISLENMSVWYNMVTLRVEMPVFKIMGRNYPQTS